MQQADDSSAEVLVIGAGPVGLCLALELGLRGRRVLVIEQGDRAGRQPRAKSTNLRSMTHMRRWGLADRLREASPLPPDYPTDIVFATRLFGRPLARFADAFFGYRARHPHMPEPGLWVPQYTVEGVVRERLQQLPNVRLRFGTRLERIEQDDRGVTAHATDTATGRQVEMQAQYAVGADGGRGVTRRLLGIDYEGEHAYMANFLAIYRAPGLLESHPLPKAVSYWLVNADSPAVTGPMDRGDTWFYSTQLREGDESYSRPEARQKILRSLGHAVDIEILETDVWYAHKLIANRYRERRVFLAGDACHLHPPMGGYGMNQGIGDAVDLGWKLAAVLHGWAAPALLDSYEVERKPVHRMFVEEAAHNYSFVTHHMVKELLEADSAEGETVRREVGERILQTKEREFRPLGAILGYTYAGSPMVIADGSAAPRFDAIDYVPSARPGAIAPHLWLADGSSLYDHFGPDLTLLDFGAVPAEAERLLGAAAALGIPLRRVAVPEPAAESLYDARLVLVRPDQHVAWRARSLDADPLDLLERIAGRSAQRGASHSTRQKETTQ
ncbi:MAG: FAD-dependent oxidoreductase [Burkholderiaceae bacterium]